MIVLSGALVLVALVLLVLGVTGPQLDLVHGSIVVSLVAMVFLGLSIRKRRGEVLPAAGGTAGADLAAGGAQAGDPEPSAEPVSGQPLPEPVDPLAGPVVADTSDAELGSTVLVVPNRPRYHVPGCRYLTGKPAEDVDVVDAREAGFLACGVCDPDAVLATRAGAGGGEPPQARAARTASDSAPARLGTASARTGSVKVPPAPRVPAEQVVVIPDRNRYHRAECRHVREFAGAETVTTAQAAQQGYSPCGVCKP